MRQDALPYQGGRFFSAQADEVTIDGGFLGDSAGVVEGGFGDGVECLAGQKALVRGDDDVALGNSRIVAHCEI